jgi:hypothetical protein
MQANTVDKFDLKNESNYKQTLGINIISIIIKYSQLINEFLFFCKNNLHIQSCEYQCYVIGRGITLISFLFYLILMYSNNVELTYHHCQKSFYYYIEFIGQIAEDNNSFLRLNSNDAILFVYKKTIFEIDNSLRSKHRSRQVDDEFIIIHHTLHFYKTIICEIIHILSPKINNSMGVLCEVVSEVMELYINHLNGLKHLEQEIFVTNINIIFSAIHRENCDSAANTENSVIDCKDLVELTKYIIKKKKTVNKLLDNNYFTKSVINKTNSVDNIRRLIQVY